MKFEKWLKENGFKIIISYKESNNSIEFEKNNLRFRFCPCWYNGNKIGAYTILHNKNSSILLKNRDSITMPCSTQKEAIEEFSMYCKENGLL